jgi:hypothetical protein
MQKYIAFQQTSKLEIFFAFCMQFVPRFCVPPLKKYALLKIGPKHLIGILVWIKYVKVAFITK